MFNDWLTIGPLTIHGYGFMIAVGVIVGLTVAERKARARGMSDSALDNMVWTGLICGLIGLVAGALITGLMILLRNNDGKTDTTIYAPKGAFRIISQDDRYIRTTVTKRKIETSSGGSGGGGGGGGFSGGGSGGGHGGSRGF